MRTYVVIDDTNNNAVWDDTGENAWTYTKRSKAEARAAGLAMDNPGRLYWVCRAVSEVSCGVSDPIIERLE